MITTSPWSRGEFDETWCFISFLTFVFGRFGFVVPTWSISGCLAGQLGLVIFFGPGKSKSKQVSRSFTDEVFIFFSVSTFALERSRVTVPSWHGFAPSERQEHGLSRGREDPWVTAPSGRSFDFTFVLERSRITVPFWHGCSLSERREHGPSRGREDSWVTAPSGRSFDFSFVFERSLTAMPSWHGVILLARWEHTRSRDRDGFDETAVWGPFGGS